MRLQIWVCVCDLCHFALLKRGCADSVVGLELTDAWAGATRLAWGDRKMEEQDQKVQEEDECTKNRASLFATDCSPLLQGISAVGISLARYNRWENRRPLAILGRQDIAHLWAFKVAWFCREQVSASPIPHPSKPHPCNMPLAKPESKARKPWSANRELRGRRRRGCREGCQEQPEKGA